MRGIALQCERPLGRGFFNDFTASISIGAISFGRAVLGSARAQPPDEPLLQLRDLARQHRGDLIVEPSLAQHAVGDLGADLGLDLLGKLLL